MNLKTKEEMLMPALKEAFGITAVADGYRDNAVLKAMQEYADQSMEAYKERLKEAISVDSSFHISSGAEEKICKLIDTTKP